MASNAVERTSCEKRLAAAWGCTRLEVETDFTKNFLASSDIVKAYDLVEARLGGAGVWDVIGPAPPPEELNTRKKPKQFV